MSGAAACLQRLCELLYTELPESGLTIATLRSESESHVRLVTSILKDSVAHRISVFVVSKTFSYARHEILIVDIQAVSKNLVIYHES